MTDFRINIQFLKCNTVFKKKKVWNQQEFQSYTCNKKLVKSESILRISLRAFAIVELFLNEAVCATPSV